MSLADAYLSISTASDNLISNAIKTSTNDWAGVLTDIIAVSAALGALALPISLNVIEATRGRYKSPTLVSIYKDISGINPQRLNLSLFSFLALSILYKLLLLSHHFETYYLIPPLLALCLTFLGAISALYRHLNFTYKLMSNISTIKESIIQKIETNTQINTPKKTTLSEIVSWGSNQKKQTQKIQKELILTLLEIETYELTTDLNKKDISNKIREIAYKSLKNLPQDGSRNFLETFLDAFPTLLSEIENTREPDIYQKAAGLYLAILPKALIACERFTRNLLEAERIARYREKNLPHHGRFFRNGRIFLNCQLINGEISTYRILFDHFKSLANNIAQSDHSDLPALLRNINSMVSWSRKANGEGWNFAYSISELWNYQNIGSLAKDVDKNFAGTISHEDLFEKFEKKYIPEMQAHLIKNCKAEILHQKQEKMLEVFLKLKRDSAVKETSNRVNVETLHILAKILVKSPEVFVQCRELINPAGASGFNVGGSPVPSSIGACLLALTSEEVFADNFPLNETLEFRIIDAIGALIIYEIWQSRIFSNNGKVREDKRPPITVPNAKIGELKSAISRLGTLRNSFDKILSNKSFTDTLGLLPSQIKLLRSEIHSFHLDASTAFKAELDNAIATRKLSSEQLTRFENEFFDDTIAKLERLPLLKKIKIGPCSPYIVTIPFERETFLEDTNVDHVFNGLGNIVTNYHELISAQILFRSSLSSESSWPSPFGQLVVLSDICMEELEKVGFEFNGDTIIWPSKTYSAKFTSARIKENRYYSILKSEHPVVVNFSQKTRGLPISIETIEENGAVIQKILYHISLNSEFMDVIS